MCPVLAFGVEKTVVNDTDTVPALMELTLYRRNELTR